MLVHGRSVPVAAVGIVAALVLPCLTLLSSCGGSGATETTPPVDNPRGQSPGYAAATIGFLNGDVQSIAFAVNAAGQVVGQSANGTGGARAFYWDGTLHSLNAPGTFGGAYALSNGSPVYAGGYQETAGVRHAARWTPASSTAATVLDASDSFVRGLNDAGTAVGRYVDANAAVHGAIWRTGASRIDIPPLAGHVHTSAEDINNDGIVIGVAFGTQSATDKAWVRLADGELLELAGLPGATGTNALALSDVVNGRFYIVGSSTSPEGARRGVRWTFELATKTVTPEPLGDMAVATGVTNAGHVSGISASGGPSQPALLWRDGVSLTLSAGAIAGGRGVAGATGRIYVVGDVFAGAFPVAVRWTIESR